MSKKHHMMDAMEEALNGIDRTFSVQVGASTWKLRVLSRTEETRARAMVKADNILSAFADSNVPQLAWAVVSINDVPASQLFEPETKDEHEAAGKDHRQWIADQLHDWIADQPTTVTETLWMSYLDQKDKVAEDLKKLQNFSNRTPIGS